MLFLKKVVGVLSNFFIIHAKLKYYCSFLFLIGKYDLSTYIFNTYKQFNFLKFKESLSNAWLSINVGFIGMLYLNGLGFKSTRKKNEDKKHWRFNVGHSHVFKYYPPKDIIMKVKTRLICIFGSQKMQVLDIINKLRSFHLPDAYKGVGMKYPDEIIRLKKGKTRQ